MIDMAKNKKMKKIIGIVIGVIIGFIVLISLTTVYLLSPISKDDETVVLVISKGDSKEQIAENLKNARLIRSKYATLGYIFLSGKKNILAGSYELKRNMSVLEIVDSLVKGNVIQVKKDSVAITFKEGQTLKQYLELIADNTSLEKEEIMRMINDKNYLKTLINDYWFLTNEVLNDNIYYALEGYLYPNTYEFYLDTDLNSVIRKMLDTTDKILSQYKDQIEVSNLSVHELLTMASIVEKEALNYEDRTKVAQVIFTRIAKNMSLGMDVTSYYGVQKDMTEVITKADLNDNNPYNTRVTSFLGLPVGPICNPSKESIEAVLNPAKTNYIYFFADINTGNVYFTDDASEFENFKKIYG